MNENYLQQKINAMKAGGKILHTAFEYIGPMIKPGIATIGIDNELEKFIIDQGGSAGFKTVADYQYASCITINDQVVHTRPGSQIIAPGDIVTVDAGVLFDGYHTDKSITYAVESDDPKLALFLKVGQETLLFAIDQAKEGNYVWDISHAIELNLEKYGYKVIHDLTGHGIGRKLHQDPFIPGFTTTKRQRTQKLTLGMTLAVEVIYSLSTNQIRPEGDDPWSLVTVDGSRSACFEETILITENKPLILT